MQSNTEEYLIQRVQDLQRNSKMQQELISQLKVQNQKLMAIVVQASQSQSHKTNDFVTKIEKLVLHKFQALRNEGGKGTIRLKTEGSAKKQSTEKNLGNHPGKQNEALGGNCYAKMKKRDLKSQMETLKRIERKLL